MAKIDADDVVVGAGWASCVPANRVSADGARHNPQLKVFYDRRCSS